MKPIIPVMRTALEQIQGMHKLILVGTRNGEPVYRCITCISIEVPCATRKLADAGLTDHLARTNQGENNE